MTEAEVPQDVKDMNREELEQLATIQSKALELAMNRLEAAEEPTDSGPPPSSLPTANYFKISTNKFQMEFNSSEATLDSVVTSAIGVINQLNEANMPTIVNNNTSTSPEYL